MLYPLAFAHERLEHATAQRLAAESLGHLLGVGRRLGAKGRELACERMFA